ncbi:MAG: ATP synthase subunit I [Pseudomonadota bacterium]|nr:ATP synthase subunit I [Pseudomonadota bacterium]
MSELLQLVTSCSAGALLGLAFFLGLWSTINGLDQARRPALLMLGSLLLRFGLVIAGFYLLARYAGSQHVLSAALGFTLARLIMVRRIRPRHRNKESQI